MQNHLHRVWMLTFILMIPTITFSATPHYITFEVDIYGNPQCSGQPIGIISIDASKHCNTYSYVDSKGKTITGSQNNVRCYRDKIVYDKYPFSEKCLATESYYQGKQFVEKNSAVPVNVCQKVLSHDGYIYEKLTQYTYPGNENCFTESNPAE